ncbi:hypothetical protein N7517_001446 [Penicillium concentricum]|uniref:Uncharacterized protein n=1 Tax=Penicillium concentricum TaxID=293559 RepID=A0A9W9SSX8_9EURO|nr:uncharacterized protein N7517_001446 [Penicillium concentricum]KAJ5383535.1 hypothetical protein N7517_001446 [Penicillium concentricum]
MPLDFSYLSFQKARDRDREYWRMRLTLYSVRKDLLNLRVRSWGPQKRPYDDEDRQTIINRVAV